MNDRRPAVAGGGEPSCYIMNCRRRFRRSWQGMVPWRVKNFVAERFPTVYHLAINAGRNRNSQEHWDAALARTWDAPNRSWPVKVGEIAWALTRDISLVDVGCGTGSILRGLRDR